MMQLDRMVLTCLLYTSIIMYMLNNIAGIDLTYVPYDDGGMCQAALLGGHIGLSTVSLAAVSYTHLPGAGGPAGVRHPHQIPDHKTVGKKESVTGVDLMYDRAVPGYIK